MPFIHIKWTQVELFRCSARWTCSAKQQLKNVRLVDAHQCRARSKTLRSSRKTLHTQLQKKTTVSTKHLNFTASPSYFITQLQPLSICHWQHYYNLCHFEGPSYSGFIERLSIQKQTKKKFSDVGKIIHNIFRRIEYRFLLDTFLESANLCIYLFVLFS